MQPLNAIDAITPAFSRTHELLFKPFRLGRLWKLCATQYLGLMGAFFLPFPLMFAFIPGFGKGPGHLGGMLALVVATALFLYFFYIGVRLQFVNFEMIVTRERIVAPMWRRYGSRVASVLWFKVALGMILSAAVAVPVWRIGEHAIPQLLAMQQIKPGEQADPAQLAGFLHVVLAFYGLVFLAFFLFKFFSTLFEDFALPFYILEDIPLRTAIRFGSGVIAADPLHCFLYLVMKMVLSVAGFIMQYIANLIASIPAFIILFFGALLGVVLAGHHGAASKIVVIFGAVILYGLFFAYTIYVGLICVGYLSTALEAYSIYFLAGRYPRLASLLEPAAPPAYVYSPPPVFPSAEERKDDNDDGPSLPMDPVLA